jgi:ABC-type nitrate/sulfonate/bicarbonate transport system permease component
MRALAVGTAAVLLPFLLWWLTLKLLGTSPIVARTPWGVADYLFLAPASAQARAQLVTALLQTLPITLVGMAAGLACAFLLATAFDLVRAYGASWWRELAFVAVPSASPYLFTSAKLAVPRALLGVMIAQWLATGTGLGNLLNQARGYLDYGMIWTVAVVSVMVSVLFYQLVAAFEEPVLRRFGLASR